MTFSFYFSEGCVKYLIKLGHARWVMTSLSLVVVKKNDGNILNNFCVYVQNHICKSIKRQKYNIISVVSTKYFNRNQSILL